MNATPQLSALGKSDFEFLVKFILEKSAIALEVGKGYLIESRLLPLLQELGLASISELVTALKQPVSANVVRRVIDAMTTNETSFYRDIHPFNVLKQEIIPKMIQARSKERKLTLWSNACSSGQEVYSIAMMLRDSFPELRDWKLRIIASDLSTQILDKAKAGSFNQIEVSRGLPASLLIKNFKQEGMFWKLKDEIRRMVEFHEINLIERWPTWLKEVDVVFLRNVLIYFKTDAKTEVLRKVRTAIRPDGYLFLGAAETTMNLQVPFERVQREKTAFYVPC